MSRVRYRCAKRGTNCSKELVFLKGYRLSDWERIERSELKGTLQLPAIVAFEIKADDIQNVFKLSQNRDEKSYRNIIKKLEEKGNASLVAAEMTNRLEHLFPEGVEWDDNKFLS